ncbi:uvrD-like Helicase, ATP-binding domain, P-loop containing nucleoside triphosphate hydrolase [Artemisia annua]|uniref:UvrD-like Helicase, ATP-binding domain, P-loop containing nucleoside triphosphate hydrolase n=1 Tax=Artemisia annua TaxID=35608 RepID=A0A2U1MUA1_ARTAN|nr:uvrD-like Helicase, ATP-binding domain, P-loop containing nucleoside triphosphate hydrolase [Artemisia annua]
MDKGSCLGEGDEDGFSSKMILSCSLDLYKNKVEKELEQVDDLLNKNSVLYEYAKWKVLFSDDFRRSFGKLTCDRLKKLVLNLLVRLSTGWRPDNISLGLCRENSSKQQFNVEGLYIICILDIIKEIQYVQVMKVWDILPYEEIPKLTKPLENIFSLTQKITLGVAQKNYSRGMIIFRLQLLNLEVPRCWPVSQEIIRFRLLVNDEGYNEESVNSGGGRNYIENSKVSESLLLKKFYSLSYEVVCHLLSGKDVDLPMQLTDEQMDVLLFSKSSFLIGRSGTGKTTILTAKLFQNEERFWNGSEGIYGAESNQISDAEVIDDPENSKRTVLRQLFVTFSPKLCYAVKQHISNLKSTSRNRNLSAGISLDGADVTSEFSDIPDTFIEIPGKMYPLVITFHKFLMMLDGTLGNSFFERFLESRESYVALQAFIRLREVTFDRFCSLYWPHFNSNLTKKLDPSRVFTEIISHIKGGREGKLSYEGYSLLAESRTSTLSKENREIVYTLYKTYEKMKSERRDFDLGDFVNDIHQRLSNGNYEGDRMDFVYIDEVQDLSMRQISLFKFICQNVEEGFMFAGDTAQTIARGIDFRFQDIRSLFYKEFLSTRISRKQEKGRVSKIKQLKQNFRTHVGVLDLAQSVIDILYCYFVHSIDNLQPETSPLSGEAPVLLEACNKENAIVTIFGGSKNGGETVGFGAEQVILVRDDCARTEIIEYVGRQALVLTILECKGLEFQDVLLYNFFGTSPLKDQWRVIYGYMKQHNWLADKLPQSFPTFDEARHSLLCSELKQLYVAITRTRQRLWICENKEELSKPMFDYWKMKGLVQIRKLDDSVAQAMRVASSPQEWRERGKKLFYENNFVMATLCFERAGDTMWEKLAKASDLRASADQIRGTNHESYLGYLREAAGIYESVGKLESAALCYYDLGEYERSGRCGKMDAAAECFSLAGCYSDAAEAYAKGDKFSNCLSVCKKGKLFDRGLQYIESWKKDFKVQSKEIEQIEQEFLESGALEYYEHKDPKSMMKFVRAFCSMESKRIFLRSLGCLDDLLLLEEESGHFVEAADLAKSWGDLLKEADLLEKAGDFHKAATRLISYVLFRAAWGNGNTGWPLKQFDQMEEICNKVKSLAKMASEDFYEFVFHELKVISDQHNSLPELKKDLHASQEIGSFRGEILSIRKILDAHFQVHLTKYEWEDEFPIDTNEHYDKIFENQVSIQTLVFYWNLWKKHLVVNFEKIGTPANVFCFTYLGLDKYNVNGNMVCLLFDKDADWVRNYAQKGLYGNWKKVYGHKGLQKDGKRVTIDEKELVFAIWSYWRSELLSVGTQVLEILEALYKSKLNGSAFHQCPSLLHICEVSKFLFYHPCVAATDADRRKLQRFLEISFNYFDFVFPLDWRNAASYDLVTLKETDLSVNLLEEIIDQMVDITSLGRVLMICLSSRVSVAVYEKLINKLTRNPQWKSFVEKFRVGGLKGIYVAPALLYALEDSFRSDGKYATSLTPHSLVYLLDHLILMQSFSSRIFYTTKSTFVTSFTHIHAASTSLSIGPSSSEVIYVVKAIQQILYRTWKTKSFFQTSKMEGSYYPLLVLKMVMILSLICLKVKDCCPILLELLCDYDNIAYLLPKKFVRELLRKRKNHKMNLNPEVVAEAFKSIDDPLVIVSLDNANPKIEAPCAIFVDLRKSKEEIMNTLFPRKNKHYVFTSSNNDDTETILEVSSSKTLPHTDRNMNCVEQQLNWNVLEDISKAINGRKGVALNKLSAATMIKEELDIIRGTLAIAWLNQESCFDKYERLVNNVDEGLKVLSYAFDSSRLEVKHRYLFESVELAVVRLQSHRPRIDDFLKNCFMSQESKVGHIVVSGSSCAAEVKETGDEDSLVEMMSENHSSGDSTQDARNKKGKGNNKVKKSKKNKGKKK